MTNNRRTPLLPESLAVGATDWNEEDLTEVSYVVRAETDFSDAENGTLYLQALIDYAEGMRVELRRKYGNRIQDHMRAIDVFACLFDNFCNKLYQFTRDSMSMDNDEDSDLLTCDEMKLFVGHLLVKQSIKLSPLHSWDILTGVHINNGLPTMSLERWLTIVHNLRAYKTTNRSPTSLQDPYDRCVNIYDKARELEVLAYKATRDLCMPKSPCFVVDDELNPTKAKDGTFESKTLSNRKAGKEGRTSDTISCSFTSLTFGTRLRTGSDNQAQNVMKLLNTIEPCDSISPRRVTIDRGYGKYDFLRRK